MLGLVDGTSCQILFVKTDQSFVNHSSGRRSGAQAGERDRGVLRGELHREEQRDEGDEPAQWGAEVSGRDGTHIRHPGWTFCLMCKHQT